jgi:hypothetical protein
MSKRMRQVIHAVIHRGQEVRLSGNHRVIPVCRLLPEPSEQANKRDAGTGWIVCVTKSTPSQNQRCASGYRLLTDFAQDAGLFTVARSYHAHGGT